MEESSVFHNPPECSLSMLNTQGGEWGSTILCGPKSPLNCHSEWVSLDAVYQGHNHTLSLLQEYFWWPGMTKQMSQSIRACTCCHQYEGGFPKVPLCPNVAMVPLDLLHVDFISIETTLEPNQLHRIDNVLMVQDHFTKHVLAYVTPYQTLKTITKFLYRGYISIFGALTKLLSERDASLTSSVIEEMCKIFSMKWLWTMPYHP